MNAAPRFLIGLVGLALCGCPATDDDPTPTGGDTGMMVEFECDPVGANPEVGALLNAPLDADVEVIMKDPQHPGDPGPENLP